MKQLKIKIKDKQRKVTINKKIVTRLAKQILKIKGLRSAELSILFVGKSRIRRLNKRFRRIDRPTDVLSFSQRAEEKGGVNPEILGDVVICPEIAQKFAGIYKTTTEHEIYLCLVHGILHLLGYDDSSAKPYSLMEKEQARILKKLTRDGKTKCGSEF